MTEHPIHLCPICGAPAQHTGRWCTKHMAVVMDSQGNVLSRTDTELTQYGIRTVTYKAGPR